ncbi:MAG: LytTR family DNA-binding domain-containing protein [Bacteroidales bacterium]|jgi:DNA-binding LytR/AlgR family response regulator|nr:LytTR family DNA-binding domain-containing protein [Bacteroidales bacterium]
MIRCIAVDDNAHDLGIVGDYIAKIPFLELLRTFDNAFHAIEFIDREKVDLIFTDVEMPVLTGLEFLGSLRNKPYSIIISEQEQYAVDAFNLDAVDYLRKPLSFERFLKAVNKVREQIRLHTQVRAPEQGETQDRGFIFIKSDYKTIRINTDDILFIEGLKDYVKLHIVDKPVLSLLSLRTLEQGLSPERFVRVHRSYIVALNKIDIIEKSRIKIGQHSITISDMYRDAFLKKIQLLK